MTILKQVPDRSPGQIREGERVLLYIAAEDSTAAILEAEDWCRQHGLRRAQEQSLPVRLLEDGTSRAYQATCYRPYAEELALEQQDREAFRALRDSMPPSTPTSDLLHQR
jgi:hypothetical protein